MKLSDFDFELPEELIAQEPAKKRDHSDLLVCQSDGELNKTKFYNLLDYVEAGDVFVFNDSKVINAQLTLTKDGKTICVNLNKELNPTKWTGFARPAKRLEVGDEFQFGPHNVVVTERDMDGVFCFDFELKDINVIEFLEEYGEVPLPPYIKRDSENAEDKDRYQSVLAKYAGSVAAPTASLHFTEELVQKITDKGARLAFVTLHVGAGTYRPIYAENIEEHVMHSEYASISEESAEIINEAKSEGRRVIAVGTTAMRSLESFVKDGQLTAGTADTSIFIKPGYKFEIADALITNFHLPKSTLFILICAFSGYDEMKAAYEFAIKERMRFFSYGDAMMIFRKEK